MSPPNGSFKIFNFEPSQTVRSRFQVRHITHSDKVTRGTSNELLPQISKFLMLTIVKLIVS